MDLTNETFAPLRVLIDEFVRAGARHAVAAPGSRDAPLIHVLGDRPELTTWSVLDERQAGFFALGLARASGLPTLLTCTSGSAVADLHPAVLEASHAGVPLIVLSADRPPELRDVGAGQAIDQLGIFGTAVRWFVEAGSHPVSDETLRHFRALAGRAWSEACSPDAGPVHINLPLREPLRPAAVDLGSVAETPGATGRPGGAPWTRWSTEAVVAHDLAPAFHDSQRPLVVVGEVTSEPVIEAIIDLCGAAGVPVLADPLSQGRRRGEGERAVVSCAYDLFLRDPAVRENLAPDLVVRVGPLPTSKPLRAWLAELDARQIILDRRAGRLDATRNADEVWQADPGKSFAHALSSDPPYSAATVWTERWTAVEQAAQESLATQLAATEFPSEPGVVRSVLESLDGPCDVFISSSMPIRDVEAFAPLLADDIRLYANRGTNGIDGVLSTALGVAAAAPGRRTLLLTGDLALHYDISALSVAATHEIPLTIVCLDNHGGGIFSFLPVAEHREHFERLIATPQRAELTKLATAYGLAISEPQTADELQEALVSPGLVRLVTDREENRALHQSLAEGVLAACRSAVAGA